MQAIEGRQGRFRGERLPTRIHVERFNIGDPALILPRFAHLYPTDSGVIVTSKPDPRRYAFNEYTVRFPDGSTLGDHEE